MLRSALCLALGIALAGTGCERAEQALNSAIEASKKMGHELADAAGKLTEATKEKVIPQLEELLKNAKPKVDELVAKAKSLKDKPEFQKAVDKLQTAYGDAATNLGKLKDAGADKFSEYAPKVKAAFAALKDALVEAFSKS